MLRSGSIRPDRPDLFAIFRRCRHFGRRVDRPRSIPPYLCACCPARYPRSRPPDLARRPQSQTLSPAPAQLRTPFPEPQSRPPGPQLPDAACPPFGPPRNEHCPKTQTRHRPATSGRRRHPFGPRNEHHPKTQRQHRPATSGRRRHPFGSRNEHRPKTQRRHRSAAPSKKTQSSLPEQVPAGMTLIRRDVGRHHGTTG